MLNTFSHPENANQDHNDIPFDNQWQQPKRQININKDIEKSKPSYSAGAGHFGKHVAVPQKELLYDPEIVSKYTPKRSENICLHKSLRMYVYKAKVLITVKKWKQPICPSTKCSILI